MAFFCTALAFAAPAAAAGGQRAVQLCECDPALAAYQQWDFGPRDGDLVTKPAPLRLKSDLRQCVFVGTSSKPTYLYLANCTGGGAPPLFSFTPNMQPSLTRDLQTLTIPSKGLCLDADAMSAHLQMYKCISGDNDQQYAFIPGFELVVDLWTGFSNCMGVVDNDNGSTTCPPPHGAHPISPHPTPPAPAPTRHPTPASAPATWLSPRYHLNDGPFKNSDPSAPAEIGGTWVVFPDGCQSERGAQGGYFASTDLVHWERRSTNIRFGETGGMALIPVATTSNSTALPTTASAEATPASSPQYYQAVTFGGGFKYTAAFAVPAATSPPSPLPFPALSQWSGVSLGASDPHVVGSNGEQKLTHGNDPHSGLFRIGDPTAPFRYNNTWYIVLGAGRNGSKEGELQNVTQGEVRLLRAKGGRKEMANAAPPIMTDWEFVSVLYASNRSAAPPNGWAARLPWANAATSDVNSIANMFECPDFFALPMPKSDAADEDAEAEAGDDVRWVLLTSEIFQGGEWTTGGNHQWENYRVGTFNGSHFTPEWWGALDYGYVAAGKSGGRQIPVNDGASSALPSRRVFFGWNMPWSRQGGGGAEGPFARRLSAEEQRRQQREGGSADSGASMGSGDGVAWPTIQPFGSQVLPRELSLFPDGSLRQTPVLELSSLRAAPSDAPQNHYHAENFTAAPAIIANCLPVSGTQIEVNFTVEVQTVMVTEKEMATNGSSTSTSTSTSTSATSARVNGTGAGGGAVASVSVLASPDGREITYVGVNSTHLIVDQMRSTLTPDLTPEQLKNVHFFWNNAAVSNHTILAAPLLPKRLDSARGGMVGDGEERSSEEWKQAAPATARTHTVRLFLDGYNLEVFADDRVAITTNLFPTLTSSTCVGVHFFPQRQTRPSTVASREKETARETAQTSSRGHILNLDVYRLRAAPVMGVPP